MAALLTRGCLALSSTLAVWFRASSAPQATASLAWVKLRRVLAQGPCNTNPKAATNSSVRPCSGERAPWEPSRSLAHGSMYKCLRKPAGPRSTALFRRIPPAPAPPPGPPPALGARLTGEGLGQQQEHSDPDLAGESHAQTKESGQSEGAHQAAPGAVPFHQQLQEPIGRGQGQAQDKAPRAADHSPRPAGLLCLQGVQRILRDLGHG